MAVSPATPAKHEVQKTEAEIINYSIEFAAVLAAAVGSPTLQSVAHAVVDIPDGNVVAGIVTSSGVNGTTVEFQCQNGTNDTEYLITLTITLNDGQVLEECVKLLIKNC